MAPSFSAGRGRARANEIVPPSVTTSRPEFKAALDALEDTALYAVSFEPELADGAHSLLALVRAARERLA